MSKTEDFLKIAKEDKPKVQRSKPERKNKFKETSVDTNLFWDVLLKSWQGDDEENPDETKDLAKAMIHVHSDLLMLYLQTRQHHWHVQGLIFRDIHLMFDEASDTILGSIDPLAERTVALGAIVPTNPETFMKISDIPLLDETSREPKEMLKQSIEAIQEIMEDIADLNDLADEQRETGIINLVGGIAEDLEVLVYKYQQFLAVFGE